MKNIPNGKSAGKNVSALLLRLYKNSYITANTGNAAICSGERFLMAEPDCDRGNENGIVCTSVSIEQDNTAVSAEAALFRLLFRTRPDCSVILYAFPLTACSFAVAGLDLRTDYRLESASLLGEVVSLPYAELSSVKLRKGLEKAAKLSDCILLVNQGVLILGATSADAIGKLELLEYTARQNLILAGFPQDELNILPERILDAARKESHKHGCACGHCH